jgi:AcrR family transcriptional regulator
MRKGEEKRQELLNAAEKLFCAKGYEGTSVQDILNVAEMSKGGFYHHFASKEDVIKALCARRAERAMAYTEDALSKAESSMGRINAVLRGFMPLRREESTFVDMLRPVMNTPEGRAIAMTYQDALETVFLPLLKAEIAAAAAVEVVCPPVKDAESMILNLVNHCWMQAVARQMDQLDMLNLLSKYRRAVEVLLDAPYGSVEIVRVEELDEVFNRMK